MTDGNALGQAVADVAASNYFQSTDQPIAASRSAIVVRSRSVIGPRRVAAARRTGGALSRDRT
jgi:hypothetical protein